MPPLTVMSTPSTVAIGTSDTSSAAAAYWRAHTSDHCTQQREYEDVNTSHPCLKTTQTQSPIDPRYFPQHHFHSPRTFATVVPSRSFTNQALNVFAQILAALSCSAGAVGCDSRAFMLACNLCNTTWNVIKSCLRFGTFLSLKPNAQNLPESARLRASIYSAATRLGDLL